MNGADLIPRPEVLQVPSPIFRILLILTFALHLVLMNIALGGSIINAAYRLRRRCAPSAAESIPTTLALAVNLGVPPLLFLQVLFGQFFYSSSVLMASYWLAVIPLLIVAYYAAYLMQRKARPAAGTIWSVVSALLLLAIAFIYVNNMSLMLRYDRWPEYFKDKRGLMLNLSDPTLFPRFLHFALAAVAVAGIAWSLWAAFRERRGKGVDELARREGLKIFWIFTSLEALSGIAWVATLPKDVMRLFMGGSAYATAVFIVGLLLAAGMLGHAIGGKLKIAAILLAPTLVAMVLMRDTLRAGYVSKVFSESSLPVQPQYGPLALFLAALALGIGVLAWMIKRGLVSTAAGASEGGSK
jgi:hypothetical protein